MDGALREYLGYHLKRAWIAVEADLGGTLAPFGLRIVQYSALRVIVANPGLRAAELAAALAMERSNLVAVLDALEARGLIARAPSRDDRRALALRASAAGRQLAAAAGRAVAAHEQAILKAVGPRERQAFLRALNGIETALERVR